VKEFKTSTTKSKSQIK